MVTDDERREVAERLRENAEAHPDMSLILNLAFADDSLKPDGAMEWKVTSYDAAMRLADLIDPSCDRDALLALADEMEEFGNLPVKHPGIRVLHNDDFSRELGYARRIRKALGVSDD